MEQKEHHWFSCTLEIGSPDLANKNTEFSGQVKVLVTGAYFVGLVAGQL